MYGEAHNRIHDLELLIVIVVIAILAAITVVAYNGIQNRANDTMVKSDMADFRQKVLAGNVTGEFMARPDDSWEYREVKLEQIKSVIKPTQGSYNQDEPVAFVYSEDYDEFTIGAISKSGKTFVLKGGEITTMEDRWEDTYSCNLDSYFGIFGADHYLWSPATGWEFINTCNY